MMGDLGGLQNTSKRQVATFDSFSFSSEGLSFFRRLLSKYSAKLILKMRYSHFLFLLAKNVLF